MVRSARLPFLTFAALATGIYATAVTLMRMRSELRHPDAVSVGILIDLLVVVPLVFYLLPVRRAGWPVRTLIPLFLLSLTGAALVLPDQREMLKRVSEILSVPAEIGLVAWIALRVRRSLRDTRDAGADDMLDRLRTVAREIVPLRGVAEAIGFEMAVVYYSLFAWRRRRPQLDPATRVFTYHRTNSYGALGVALLIVTMAEAIPVHLLVTRWSPRGAWLLTALAAYGMLWFLADYRATRLRPILLDQDTLCIRTGLRWTVRIPRAHIVAIHKKAPQAEPLLRAALPGTTPLWIELSEPVTAQGPYGKEKKARWIAVAVDEKLKAFQEAVILEPGKPGRSSGR